MGGGVNNGRYKANYKHFNGVRLCANGRKQERRNGYKSKRANGGKIGGLEKMKKLLDVIMFLFGLGSKTQTGKDAESAKICDFSGQGRGEEDGNK
jgi:hypothetical protein